MLKTLDKKFKHWSQEEDNVLSQNYYSLGGTKLVDILNRDLQSIHTRAFKLKIKANPRNANRKYTFNENYFDGPNISNCYWAGFIAADGCISGRSCTLNIEISEKDKNLIEQFIKQTEFTGRIYYRGPRESYHKNNKKSYISKPTISIHINSSRWKEMLLKYWNIHNKKTLTLQPPNITKKDLCCSYIIGLIDGDGYIRRSDKSVGILGTYNLLSWINKVVNYDAQINQKGKIFVVNYPPKIGKLLVSYANISWKLNRKWDIYDTRSS
jgi:hypothetical protein